MRFDERDRGRREVAAEDAQLRVCFQQREHAVADAAADLEDDGRAAAQRRPLLVQVVAVAEEGAAVAAVEGLPKGARLGLVARCCGGEGGGV